MNIDKLEVGMEIKNYKEMCKLLGENVQAGNSKKHQLKNWCRYFSFEKIGQKFIIEDVYANEKPKVDGRHIGKSVDLNNLLEKSRPDLYELITKINYVNGYLTTYSISNSVTYKCINCNRLSTSTTEKLCSMNGKCKRCTLSNEAKVVFDFLEYNDLNFELEYTFKDLKGVNNRSLRFDFAILSDDELKCLIEYDGVYHSKNINNDGSYQILMEHDKRKNEYCRVIDIPLVRIDYNCDVIEKLLEELNKIGINVNKDYLIKENERKIKEKIKYHQDMLDKLNEELEGLYIN